MEGETVEGTNVEKRGCSEGRGTIVEERAGGVCMGEGEGVGCTSSEQERYEGGSRGEDVWSGSGSRDEECGGRVREGVKMCGGGVREEYMQCAGIRDKGLWGGGRRRRCADKLYNKVTQILANLHLATVVNFVRCHMVLKLMLWQL